MRTKKEVHQHPFEWIVIAKAIGIILVVVSHFQPPSSPGYWREMIKMIYTFHMELFFILSGYLYCTGKHSYYEFIKRKARRLLFPFITIAVLFFLIKFVVGKFIDLEYPVTGEALFSLLIMPTQSHMPLLWFVHALFLMFLCYPVARLFFSEWIILILLIGINIVFGSDFIFFGKALAFVPFFAFGVLLREKRQTVKNIMSDDYRYVFGFLALFLIVYIIHSYGYLNVADGYVAMLILGTAGSSFIIILSRILSSTSYNDIKAFLLPIGYYSMTVYLFHTLFESAVKIGILSVVHIIEVPFELMAFLAISCGILFPLILEKQLFRKYHLTKRYVLGLA